MRQTINTLIVLLFAGYPLLSGQNLPLERISNELGLSQNTINAIWQDQQGFLWAGTNDGLNRFDGYQFKVYTFDPYDSSSLSDNRIQALYEDNQGRLWVGTANGLNLFSREAEHFQRFLADGTPNSIPYYSVNAISEDHHGHIWVSTPNGLSRIVATEKEGQPTFQFRLFPIPGEKEQVTQILAAEEDEGGFLWVSTPSAIYRMELREGPGGYRLEKFNEKELPAHWKSHGPRPYGDNRIFKGRDGKVWICLGPGIARWNASEGRFQTYDMLGPDPDAFPHYWQGVKDITEGKGGKIWIGHFTGLDIFDYTKGQFFRYNAASEHPLAATLAYGVSAVWESRENILWVGSFGKGLYKSDPYARRFSRQESDNSIISAGNFSVRSILQHSSGNILVGVANLGFFSLSADAQTRAPIKYPASLQAEWGVVHDMLESANGEIWAASMSGLFRWAPEQEGFRLLDAYTLENNGRNTATFFYQVLEDQKGDIWVSTDSCLGKFDRNTRAFEFYPFAEAPGLNSLFPVLYESADGTKWVGTGNGLLQFDPTRKAFRRYVNDPQQPQSLSHNVIKTLCDDPFQPDRYLWIGTAGGGLNRMDRTSGQFKHFMEKDGLPDKVIYGILADSTGLLWMSTNKGLCVFSPKNFSIKNFDTSDGLQDNEFNTYAYCKSKDGRLFFGGINGFNAFLPEKVLTANPHAPSIVLTALSVDGKPAIHAGENAPISTDITVAREIRLSYLNKTIALEFAALDYTEPAKNQYAYKMDGFDNDWISAGTHRTATYTNLNPGAYTFRVRGASKEGVWSEEGAAIQIVITPPWWRTGWAYTLFAAVLLAVLIGLRQYEMGRQRLKYQLKLEKLEADNLKEADRLKARFFANISHEFRTPLTLILGQIDSLMKEEGPQKWNNRLKMAQRNAKRLLQLINELLDFSKLEAGRMEFNAQKADIIPFLKNILFSFESMAEEKGITLVFHPDTEELHLYFEPEKMTKIFYNLLSNALKFTPAGGTVGIHLYLYTERTGMVAIEVRDTGIGIPAEQLPKIFDRFFQVDGSNTRRYEGTGIGLALAKELAELHGGSIEAESQPGEGACIRVWLPVRPESEHTSEEKAQVPAAELPTQEIFHPADLATPVHAEIRPGPGQGTLILIVEDNADVRSYLREHLEVAGYQVREAADGEEGIEAALSKMPDLIITDLMMPRMDGYAFTEKIRSDEKTSHIPVVMLTAKASESDKLQGLKLGVDDYLVKPFSPAELLARINNLILLRRQLRERFTEAVVIRPSEVSAISKDQVFLQKILQTIESHLEDEQFAVPVLAEAASMSVNHLNRKLQALIDQSAGQLIRSMRLQRAAELLSQNAADISEIAYQMGFSSPANFSRSFKKQFGSSPSEYAASSRSKQD